MVVVVYSIIIVMSLRAIVSYSNSTYPFYYKSEVEVSGTFVSLCVLCE